MGAVCDKRRCAARPRGWRSDGFITGTARVRPALARAFAGVDRRLWGAVGGHGAIGHPNDERHPRRVRLARVPLPC